MANEDVAKAWEFRGAGRGGRLREMRRLVVNADDFGLTERVNEGIRTAHERGILTSTTVLANGDAFESAVKIAKENPKLGVGVHLNLTDGRPVTGAKAVSLVGEDGKFARGPGRLVLGMWTGFVKRDEVERELRGQIERVKATGIEPTHVDGHKHIHAWPAIFEMVVRLAEEYGIRAVRWGAERPAAMLPHAVRNGRFAGVMQQRVGAILLGMMAPANAATLRRSGVKTTDYFFGITETGFLDARMLEQILWNMPEGTSELMCHPGYADGALMRSGTRLVAERERELEALTAPEMRGILEKMEIELVTYREVGAA